MHISHHAVASMMKGLKDVVEDWRVNRLYYIRVFDTNRM